jgi:3-oxoacyl-(acyl-carrier-protein) synthase
MAGYQPGDIDYICADGIATKIGDVSEIRAIKRVFGSRYQQIPISAPKSMFGHLLGASGAVDVITTLLAMQEGIIPPTINYQTEDPECALDCVPNEARAKVIDRALIISRGRGGINAVLAIERD